MLGMRCPCWALISIRAIACGCLVAPSLPTAAAGQADRYHILVTNDDGIGSPGIQQLAKALTAVGTVHLVAPCGEQSGSSMGIALRDQLVLDSLAVPGFGMGYCLNTTPATVALLAITSLAPESGFDLVVSGINRGANVGNAAHLSGTVGAAMMGAFYRIPAVAASSGARGDDFGYASRFVVQFVQELRTRGATPGVVYSINLPQATEAETRGVAVAKMGGMQFTLGFAEVGEGGVRKYQPRVALATDGPPGSDTQAFLENMITITPLLFDWTAYPLVDQIRGWNLSHCIGPN